MKVLDKYILREFLRNFIISLLFFSVLLLIVRFSEKEVGKFVSDRIPLSKSIISLLLQIPGYVIFVSPPSILFAAFFSLGRMTQNNEITAMRASGINLLRIFQPVFISSFIISLLMIAFYDQVVTRSIEKDNEINRYLGGYETASHVVFEGKGRRVFYIYSMFIRDKRMQSLTIYEFDEDNKIKQEIYASTATWSDQKWNLTEGVVRTFKDNKVLEELYENMEIYVPEDPEIMIKGTRDIKAIPFIQLNRLIKFKESAGKTVRKDKVVFHDRISFPFACFVMAILGAPLFVIFGRSGMAVGFLLTMFISFLYYGIAIAVFEAFGNNGKLPPMFSCWIANFLFGIVGTGFVYKVKK